MSEVKEKLEEYINQGYEICYSNESGDKLIGKFHLWICNVSSFLEFNKNYSKTFGGMKDDKLNVEILWNSSIQEEARKKLYSLETIKDDLIKNGINLPEKFFNNIKSNKIFIVHGRDEGAKEATARFIEKLELQPVILSEQPNFCYTVMEKFEKHADESDFAIVLFTPDDIGGLQSEEEQKNRARQNVIFELGYFLGKFGRDKVCLLYKGDTELPSDIQGVTYISMDKADWKIGLCQSLKSVGFNVDANKAFG